MIDTVQIAASGLQATKMLVDTIANNVANLQTNAFRKSVVMTSDLAYRNIRSPGIPENTDAQSSPGGIQIGNGSRVVGIHRIATQGALKNTNNPLDMAIVGSGYFSVILANGLRGYTRSGSFRINNERKIVNDAGFALADDITIPIEISVESVTISDSGLVSGKDSNGATVELGQINLTIFPNEDGLEAVEGGVFIPTDAAGEGIEVIPTQEGGGKLKQRFIELSNVNQIEEIALLIETQRAYEMLAKVMNIGGEMAKTITDVK